MWDNQSKKYYLLISHVQAFPLMKVTTYSRVKAVYVLNFRKLSYNPQTKFEGAMLESSFYCLDSLLHKG